MQASRYRVRVLSGIAGLLIAGLAVVLVLSSCEREHRVVFSNGSWLVIRKVSYGKNNVYWHQSVRRAAAALVSDTTWDRVVDTWNRVIEILPGWFSGLEVTSVANCCIQSPHDYLVVFGDFSLVSAGARFWEFTGVDSDGNEGGPLETPGLDALAVRTTGGPCILADGTNVPSKWPISVRIYERDTNGTRRLLGQVPAKRAKR